MAEAPSPQLEQKLLRKRLNEFLRVRSEWKVPLIEALARLSEQPWPAVIFGGVLRDLTILGPSEVPRDVDIVVANARPEHLEEVFADLVHSKNRFGGLRLRTKGWLIDMWTLDSTWALRDRSDEFLTFDRLVQTTFLNVEGIAAEISPKPTQKRKLYSSSFFEAATDKILDISFEPNPHPSLCVVRSIMTAIRLNWVLSRRLSNYILHHAKLGSMKTLLQAQESHYGKIRIRETQMKEYLDSIKKQLNDTAAKTIRLPPTKSEQLSLSQYWTPVC
jgi:hypothetical protein